MTSGLIAEIVNEIKLTFLKLKRTLQKHRDIYRVSKMEINAKEARSKLSSLLNKVEERGDIVIVRRGKRVARLITAESRVKRLPTLKDFRASVKIKGVSLGAVISRVREGGRY